MSTRHAPDILADIRRMQEEIRQLRLRRSGDGQVMAWQPLGYYIAPHWKGFTGIPGIRFGTDADYNDITIEQAPRYYVDRDRVYLGGCVEWDSTRLGEPNVYGPPGDTTSPITASQYTLFEFLPGAYAPHRQTYLNFTECLDLTNTGWLGCLGAAIETGITLPRATVTLIQLTYPGDVHSSPVGDEILDGTVVSLDGLSWRIST